MVKELIIDVNETVVNIALTEDKQLAELHVEQKDSRFAVGDIYLGKVKKLVPSLNAAFIDVGFERDAFLHYLDLSPQVKSLYKYTKNVLSGKHNEAFLNHFELEPDIDKSGKISNVLTSNQWVIVQVAKEPISTKGPRVSSELSLAGRDIVMIPFSDQISVSQKIKSSEERTRLKRLVQSIKPKNFGVIIRTAAEGKKVADLDKDINDLKDKWQKLFDNLKSANPPQRILGELNRTSTILRDIMNEDFQSVVVNDSDVAEEIKTYLKAIAPGKENIVKLHKSKNQVFEEFGIEKQIKSLFGKTVNMPSNSYLIIEHTEALHVIDVNSGVRAKSGDNQESNALAVNLESAAEIARQLRLRDMGGIIVVDFIDMQNPLNRKALFNKLKDEMKRDRAQHTILPPSKFGLVQITRERVRPEMNIITTEKCPACEGTGEVKANVLFIDEIENMVRYFLKEQNESSLTLHVHPIVEAYLTKGLLSSIQKKWWMKYKKRVKIKAIASYHFLEYHFFNSQEEEIKV